MCVYFVVTVVVVICLWCFCRNGDEEAVSRISLSKYLNMFVSGVCSKEIVFVIIMCVVLYFCCVCCCVQ